MTGLKTDGSTKLRAIDDFTRSGINARTWPSEKLQYEALDTMMEFLRQSHSTLGCNLKLWKSDIDSAYRRIPVAAESKDNAWIVFKTARSFVAARHYALPFGSVASVHHWDRIGRFACSSVRVRDCQTLVCVR